MSLPAKSPRPLARPMAPAKIRGADTLLAGDSRQGRRSLPACKAAAMGEAGIPAAGILEVGILGEVATEAMEDMATAVTEVMAVATQPETTRGSSIASCLMIKSVSLASSNTRVVKVQWQKNGGRPSEDTG